ncbi:MAG: hypothetical protein SGARI_003925 [Bacillariaceae sp.]
MVRWCDNDQPSLFLPTIMEILHGHVKEGDNLDFGEITKQFAENIAELPKLKPGVTHEADGPFAEFQKEWLEENTAKKKNVKAPEEVDNVDDSSKKAAKTEANNDADEKNAKSEEEDAKLAAVQDNVDNISKKNVRTEEEDETHTRKKQRGYLLGGY